jgi:uncharacterized membrane protein YedE/YeeE
LFLQQGWFLVVLAFLRFQDEDLLLVMGGAVGVTLLVYQLAPRVLGRPLLEDNFAIRPSLMDRDTLLGAAIFGVGWGFNGVCPGPAIAAGAYLQGWLKDSP